MAKRAFILASTVPLVGAEHNSVFSFEKIHGSFPDDHNSGLAWHWYRLTIFGLSEPREHLKEEVNPPVNYTDRFFGLISLILGKGFVEAGEVESTVKINDAKHTSYHRHETQFPGNKIHGSDFFNENSRNKLAGFPQFGERANIATLGKFLNAFKAARSPMHSKTQKFFQAAHIYAQALQNSVYDQTIAFVQLISSIETLATKDDKKIYSRLSIVDKKLLEQLKITTADNGVALENRLRQLGWAQEHFLARIKSIPKKYRITLDPRLTGKELLDFAQGSYALRSNYLHAGTGIQMHVEEWRYGYFNPQIDVWRTAPGKVGLITGKTSDDKPFHKLPTENLTIFGLEKVVRYILIEELRRLFPNSGRKKVSK